MDISDKDIVDWLSQTTLPLTDVLIDRDHGHFVVRVWRKVGPGAEFIDKDFRSAVKKAIVAPTDAEVWTPKTL